MRVSTIGFISSEYVVNISNCGYSIRGALGSIFNIFDISFTVFSVILPILSSLIILVYVSTAALTKLLSSVKTPHSILRFNPDGVKFADDIKHDLSSNI